MEQKEQELVGHTGRLCLVYIPQNGKSPEIYLGREKNKNPLYGDPYFWKMLGGTKECTDADMIETTIREVREEGLLELGREQFTHEFIYYSKTRHPDFKEHQVHLFLVIVAEKPEVMSGERDSDIIQTKWFPIARLPSSKYPVDGSPLAYSHWRYLYRTFRQAENLLYYAGLSDVRQAGIVEAWKEKGDLEVRQPLGC